MTLVPVIVKPTLPDCNNFGTGLVVLQQDFEGIPVGLWAVRVVLDLLASCWMHSNCAKQPLCMQAVTVKLGPSLKVKPVKPMLLCP